MPSRQKTASKKSGSRKNNEASGCWLVKQEPEAYSWDDLVRDGRTDWTGVRNFQARNNLREMKVGDRVLFYHSGKEKAVVGVAEVVKAAYADPTTDDPQWVAADIKPARALNKPVPLTSIRSHPKLNDMLLLRQSRLSVMPLTKQEFDTIVTMGKGQKGKKK
jgi:predicted RNA-binding protein with PUA-like domain